MGKLFQKKDENIMSEDKVEVKKIGIIGGSVVVALLVLFVGFSFYFNSHFYFRITVNGVSSSWASVSAVL